MKSGNRFQSIVCLGTSPRVVHTDEVFVDGEDVFGMHDEYRDEKRKRGEGNNETEGRTSNERERTKARKQGKPENTGTRKQ